MISYPYPPSFLHFVHNLVPFSDSLEIGINYKWNWQLFMEVVEL